MTIQKGRSRIASVKRYTVVAPAFVTATSRYAISTQTIVSASPVRSCGPSTIRLQAHRTLQYTSESGRKRVVKTSIVTVTRATTAPVLVAVSPTTTKKPHPHRRGALEGKRDYETAVTPIFTNT